MRITRLVVLVLALAACGDDSGSGPFDAPPFNTPDAPEFAPVLTSLRANPTMVTTPGVPAQVTFIWTLQVEPTYPTPTCTMDNGVGVVTNNTPVTITISQLTVFTLTCANRAGSSMRQVVVSVPASAPQIATFTVSPTTVTAGVPTPVTFTWTYSNIPSPAPTCTVDGTTNITSGTPVTMTLTQARTFRLRCTNGVGTPVFTGSTVADVTVAADECGTAYAQCDAHATCGETASSYTCTCMNGYTPSGDTCLFNTTTATDCDQTNCPLNGATCLPKAGYYGSGQVGDCKRARYTFVTAQNGNGNIGGWAGATGTGLAAADALCNAKALAQSLPGTYVAWMSDATNDAYCRVHSDGTATGHLNGTKAGFCGQGALPVSAGWWVRVGNGTTGYKQWAPSIEQLLAPNHVTYYAANTDETGAEIASTTARVWTGTDATGRYVANATCGAAGSEWTSSSSSLFGAAGDVWGGGTSWTKTAATDPNCLGTAHIRCMEVSNTPSPVFTVRRPANTKKAFLTSVTGNGNLVGWPDNYGATNGIAASDAICQSRARYAGYPNPTTYKAWMATYPYGGYSVTSKLTNTAAGYARPDGVVLGTTRADMLDGRLGAAWEQTEANTYPAGSGDSGAVSTNTVPTTGNYYTSSSTGTCLQWQSNSSFSYNNYVGRYDLLDGRAMHVLSAIGSGGAYTQTCDQPMRLYCVED